MVAVRAEMTVADIRVSVRPWTTTLVTASFEVTDGLVIRECREL